jgi:hypothetical protein
MNAIYACFCSSLYIFNIILLSMTTSLKFSRPFKFSDYDGVQLYHIYIACYILSPFSLLLFYCAFCCIDRG